jgi:hypothetical protein
MRMARVLQLFLMDETEIVEMKESIGTRIWSNGTPQWALQQRSPNSRGRRGTEPADLRQISQKHWNWLSRIVRSADLCFLG